MADFCKQCSEELFGEDFGDLKGLMDEEEAKKGFIIRALCEGCGHIFVDQLGICQGDCDNPKHGKGKII